MRLFIGIEVPYEMRRNLELLLQLLKPKANIQWSPMNNLHITTKFVGDWPDGELEELKEALKDVPVPGDLKILIRGLGWFPNAQKPRVLYSSILAPDGLAQLARDIEKLCDEMGILPNEKEFRPHLTLARIKGPTNLSRLKKQIEELPGTDFGTFTATHFHLYQSELRPGGSIYTKLASYPLTKS